MPKKPEPIACSESVIAELEGLASNTSNPRLAKRAAIVLECVKGTPGKEVAQLYGEREATVSKWKRRFQNFGVDGLANLPRGRSGGMYGLPFQERLQSTILGPPPDGEPYWTAKLLSATLEVPLYIVTRYLRKSNIRLLECRRNAKGETPPANPKERASIAPSEDSLSSPEEDRICPPGEDCIDNPCDGEARTNGSDTVIYEKHMCVDITSCGQLHDAADQTIDIHVLVRLMDGSKCIRESCYSLLDALPNLGDFDISFNDTS